MRQNQHTGSLTVAERFWPKVAVGDGCWEWQAARYRNGYGMMRGPKGTPVRAHRVAYELLVGPIPEGLTLDHLCRNRTCVNPAHLEPVTRGENVLRGISMAAQNARKTHCKWGHPFDSENTIKVPGGRACRECRRLRYVLLALKRARWDFGDLP